MQSLARWCFQHRWLVLILWLVALAGARMLAFSTGSEYADAAEPPTSESFHAIELLERASPVAAGDVDQVVFATTDDAPVTRSQVRQRIERVMTAISALPHVASTTSPFSAAAPQISDDGHIAYGTVQFDRRVAELPLDAVSRVMDTARSEAGNGLRIEVGGEAVLYEEGSHVTLGGEGFGLLIAALVLFFAFGSLVAMGMPLLSAIVSLGTSLGIIDALSTVIPMADFTSSLASLIGLGVGIDYAMFIVSRFRRAVLNGKSVPEATMVAMRTSGRAVLFAGIVVCIALLGMFALRLDVFYGVALSASIAVAITLLAALTLQPALLSLLGHRVLSRRARRRVAEHGSPTAVSRTWATWAAMLSRRPAAFAMCGALIVTLLAAPALSLRLGFSDAGNGPQSATSRRAYDLLAQGFGPGFNGPFIVVADRTDTKAREVFGRVLASMARIPGVATVSPPEIVGVGASAVQVARLVPTTSPQDAKTAELLSALRDRVVTESGPGEATEILIGGEVAVGEDFAAVISHRLPVLIVLVLGLSFLLLTFVFRSIAVPALAAVMNLVAVAAAFGVVTAVFEHGWFAGMVGLHSTGPIEPFIPVIVFSILFGLSMDYEVFLVARIHELWTATKDNTVSVVNGLVDTGRVITAAAAIMIAIFGSFALGENRIIKLFGLSLATAVAIDALVIRTLLLPAVMVLLGRWNWALPSALGRMLPTIRVEAPEAEDSGLPSEAAAS